VSQGNKPGSSLKPATQTLKDMKTTNSILSGLLLLMIIYNGCGSKEKDGELELNGQWQALWETSVEGLENIDKNNLRMDGQVHFYENGQVEIEAFGHKGCVFSSDTLKNVLSWKLEGEILRFMDHGDDSGLPYTIKSAQENKLELVLMDDIFLTLERR
jgi:hypothetical protein